MSEFNTTGNPEPAGQCANCGVMTYVGVHHLCSTGGFYPITPVAPIIRPRRQPPAELWLHIHKDGKTATTYCPEEDCLFGRRVKYVLAEEAMNQLTDLLTELDKAATPGPLSVSDKFGAAHGFEWHVETEDGHGIWVAKCQVQADAALIVALRNHLPELLAALSEAEERVRVLVDAFETYGKHRTGCPFSAVDVCTCGYNEKWNELFPPKLRQPGRDQ